MRGTTEGNQGSTMGDGIKINRVAERLSSHTLSHSRPARHRTSRNVDVPHKRLVAALVEVVAEGSDPRLVRSRALA